jgi:hypothetical protein
MFLFSAFRNACLIRDEALRIIKRKGTEQKRACTNQIKNKKRKEKFTFI